MVCRNVVHLNRTHQGRGGIFLDRRTLDRIRDMTFSLRFERVGLRVQFVLSL